MYSRTSPYFAYLIHKELLTHPLSTKKTYHLVLKIDPTIFPYEAGDSIGILPENCPDHVHQILKQLNLSLDHPLIHPKTNKSLLVQEYLQKYANLSQIPSPFFRHLLQEKAPSSSLLFEENKSNLKEWLQTKDLLDIIEAYGPFNPSILEKLSPLLPRFYSIANSPKLFPQQIHLTVSMVEYELGGRKRFGLASNYLCRLAHFDSTPIPIYLQKAPHFRLPENPHTPVILIGPGTGIAPYRGFLQERLATQAPGKAWLFFGERNRAYDFYYESFLTQLEKEGSLRLDVAFSRDQEAKYYVQHKMYEHKKELWRWIEEGSKIYVCGNASQMAKAVEATLLRIAQEEGSFTEEAAKSYFRTLKKEGRYCLDIY